MSLHPRQSLGRHFSLDEIVCETERQSQDDQKASDQCGTLDDDSWNVLPDLQASMNDAFDKNGVEHSDCRGLNECGKTAEHTADDDERKHHVPPCFPNCGGSVAE